MRIAFVGIEKDWEDLEKRDYVFEFIKHHLELPFYYARDGENVIDIISDYHSGPIKFNKGRVQVLRADDTITAQLYEDKYGPYDVVVHWRKWFEEHYDPKAINVINSQDHTYSPEWVTKVTKATEEFKLYGILCFPEWHERQLAKELSNLNSVPPLIPGVTLGVDTQVYHPGENKSRHELLWASDIGRGLMHDGGFTELAVSLFKKNTSFRANICYPDYVQGTFAVNHPALYAYKNLDNGPELWNLFNNSGFLPYTSIFKEPSSRAHRQAMAAGCVVLYPPNMGTPSDLITDNHNGFVRPVSEWVDIITELSSNKKEFDRISRNAREYAVSENWEVQAKRFNELFRGLLNDR